MLAAGQYYSTNEWTRGNDRLHLIHAFQTVECEQTLHNVWKCNRITCQHQTLLLGCLHHFRKLRYDGCGSTRSELCDTDNENTV